MHRQMVLDFSLISKNLSYRSLSQSQSFSQELSQPNRVNPRSPSSHGSNSSISQGRTWSTFRGEVVLFTIKGCLLQHGLGTQDSDQIRNPTWSFGDFDPDRAPGRVLCAILTYVLVC